MTEATSLQTLAETLLDDTRAGRVKWRIPVTSDGTWLIYSGPTGESVDIRQLQADSGITYVMRVYNSQSSIVDSLRQPERNSTLGHLYHAAVNQVNQGSAQVINSLLRNRLGRDYRTLGLKFGLMAIGVALLTLAVAGAVGSERGFPIAIVNSPARQALSLAAGIVIILCGWVIVGSSVIRTRLAVLARSRLRRVSPRPAPYVGLAPDRNPHFVDRETEIDRVGHVLARAGRVNLTGLGGVGKTQLALEYVHRHRSNYPDGVFWLRGDSATALRGDFAGLAWSAQLNLDERHATKQQVIDAVTNWLRLHQQWLLVVDNLDESAIPVVNDLVDPSLPGRVLMTSRVPLLDRTILAIEPLPPDVATEFLLERSGQSDTAAAAAIVHMLGGLPLAVAQAAAYVRATGRDLASYATLLQSRLGDLMETGSAVDYPSTVASTLRVSFDRIERQKPEAASLLRLCAFLATDVPIAMLQDGANELPDDLQKAVRDAISLDVMIGELLRYSLVERRNESLRIHRLVQAIVRESLSTDEWQRWIGSALRLVNSVFPEDVTSPSSWAACGRLLPQALVLLTLLTDQIVEPLAFVRLLTRTATYLELRADYSMARAMSERAMSISAAVLGPDVPETARSLANLGAVLQAQGELAAARPLMERAVAICERVLGPEHPDTAQSLDNLASLLYEQGELAGARNAAERAITIRERALGPDNVSVARSLSNLAAVLQAQGDVSAARRLVERALAIDERLLGGDHPDTARTIDDLAVLLRAHGELAAARPLAERALSIHERVLGPDHPETARSLSNLATLLQAQGEFAAAQPLMARALTISERVLGPDHPATAWSLSNLATLLQLQGEGAAARPLMERALAIRELILGPDHPDTARSLDQLATLLQDQSELAAARPLMQRALATYERALGPDHPETVRAVNRLATLFQSQSETRPPDP